MGTTPLHTSRARTTGMIMMWFVLAAALGIPSAARGHDWTKAERSTLTVTGTARLALAPDTAFVTLGMETVGRSLPEVQRQNHSAMKKVAERLRDLQVEKEYIQTASFTVSPQYKPPPKRPADAPPVPPEIVGYVVHNSVAVEVRNLENVGAVIESALAAGANRFQGLRWGLRDEQQAKLGALKLAAAKARDKAAALGEALNAKLIRLVSVNEDSHLSHATPRPSRSMTAMEAGGEEPPIFPGEMHVEATVTLIYEIGQE